MSRTLWMVVAAALAATVAAAGPADEPEADEALAQAHKDLQRALETIREFHLQERVGELEALTELDEDLLVDLRRPRLGILVDSSSPGDRSGEGAVVLGVTPGGPADDAGLVSGDVITHIAGVARATGAGRPHDVLVRELATRSEGDSVTVDFVRDGEARSVAVELRGHEGGPLVFRRPLRWAPLRDLEAPMSLSGKGAEWMFPGGWLDMELVSLNGDLGEYFGTDEGVLVVRGPSGGELELRSGDVILTVDDRIVRSPTHAMRILRSYDPGERLTLEIMRHGRRQTIESTMPEHRVPLLEYWAEKE